MINHIVNVQYKEGVSKTADKEMKVNVGSSEHFHQRVSINLLIKSMIVKKRMRNT